MNCEGTKFKPVDIASRLQWLTSSTERLFLPFLLYMSHIHLVFEIYCRKQEWSMKVILLLKIPGGRLKVYPECNCYDKKESIYLLTYSLHGLSDHV